MSNSSASGDLLLQRFAAEHPAEFAAQLAAAGQVEALAVIEALPVAARPAVIVQLPQSLAERALSATDDDTVSGWLNTAADNVAIGLLMRLPDERRRTLIGQVKQAVRRQTLKRVIDLPGSCVGALAQTDVLRLRADGRVEAVLRELRAYDRQHRDSAGMPAVALDAKDRVLGFFDTALALRLDDAAPARDCVIDVPILYAETATALAADAPGWRRHAWLPVVDHDRRLLGLLSREALLQAAEQRQIESAGLDVLTVELGGRLFTVMADLLALLLGREPAPSKPARRKKSRSAA